MTRRDKHRRRRRNGSFAFRDFDTHDVRIIIHAPYSKKYGKPMIWQRVLTINDYERLWRHAGGMPWMSDAVRFLKHATQKVLEKGGPFGDMPRCSSVGVYVNSMLYGDEDYVLRDMDGSLFLDEPGTLKVDLEGGCFQKKNPLRPGETYDGYLRRLERAGELEELALAKARVRQEPGIKRGTPVFARMETVATGVTTGGVRSCGLEGCSGVRVGVRWEDGSITWPCSEGLHRVPEGWAIV